MSNDNPRSIRSYRVEILIALLVIVVVGPLVHEYRAQQASRYLLTAAIWDNGTIQLDEYAAVDPPILGVDRAVKDGHTYSDKAPLQPVLAVPFYAVYRAIGGEPAIERRIEENLGLWWVTFWMATVPAALLAALMFREGRRIDGDAALPATIGLFGGSILLPFAALLFGHALAALFVFAAFLTLKSATTPLRLAGAGALCGAAVTAEYTAGVALVALTAYAVWRARSRVVWFLAGGVPFAVGLGWYHTMAFGTPLTHPYRYSAFTDVTSEARGFFSSFSRFRPEHVFEVFFDGRGFLFAAPMVIVGLIGLVQLVRTRSPHRSSAVLALAMFVGVLLIPVFWSNPWGGDSPGPRYMTPALPFLVIGAAAIWRRSRIWGRAAAAIGGFTMGLATLTDPLLSDEARVSIGSWIGLAADGEIVPTVFTIAVGPVGWLVHVALIAFVGWRLVLVGRKRQPILQPPG
ncbi:MAG: hypothetical protein QNJ88_11995 [Acidimicrobiia bacterium]|nr:hypothetical protein [Acidimicrobiia bacterium]